MTLLAQLTIHGGAMRMASRADTPDASVAAARALLDEALERGAAQLSAALGGYAIAAERFGSHLLVTVLAASRDEQGLERIALFGVASISRGTGPLWRRLQEEARALVPRVVVDERPPTPWTAFALLPEGLDYEDATSWIGELERSIAWAWLERHDA